MLGSWRGNWLNGKTGNSAQTGQFAKTLAIVLFHFRQRCCDVKGFVGCHDTENAVPVFTCTPCHELSLAPWLGKCENLYLSFESNVATFL